MIDFLKKHMLNATVAASLLSVSLTATAMDDLTILEEMAHRRAIETVVWSMPLMNTEAMRRGLFAQDGGDFNTVFYNSKVQTWKLKTTTNNNTTPYVLSFWNVGRDGPVVIEIPPAIEGVSLFGTLMDAWQRPLEDVGAKGADRGRGAKYLIVPPNYQGSYPAGYITLEQKTNNGYTLMRPIISGATPENLQKAQKYVKQIKIYPLSEASNSPKTQYVDIYDKHVDGIPHFDSSYFEDLHNIIQEEVIEERDLSMMGLLKEIGIVKGGDYKINNRTKAIFEDAAKEAQEFLVERYFNSGINASFYGKDSQWTIIMPSNGPETGFSFQYPSHVDIDSRGAVFSVMYTTAKHWNFYDAATFYLLSNKDNSKQQLNGSHNYKLTIPKDVPIKHFWSAIAYTVEDATWFENQPKSGVASIDKGLKTNADGSVDIYLGPKSPKGKEANWIPTTKDIEYFIYFRVYGPTQEFFKRKWELQNIIKLD
jgi:hypothetical protein